MKIHVHKEPLKNKIKEMNRKKMTGKEINNNNNNNNNP